MSNAAKLMNDNEFSNFFKEYSQNVDNAERIGFWKLCDEIVERICLNLIGAHGQVKCIFDAGGGTGRWIERLSRHVSSDFVLFDRSPDMLEKARIRFSKAGITDRIKIVEGDLEQMGCIAPESVDFIISTYGVISFLNNPPAAFVNMNKILRPGGIAMVMGHGFYNSLYSKIMNNKACHEELQFMVRNQQVKWAPHVPSLRTFTQESLALELETAGFVFEKAYGIPVMVQPGLEDFDPENIMISAISHSLLDESFSRSILELEMKFNSLPEVVNRGVNILAVARKPNL